MALRDDLEAAVQEIKDADAAVVANLSTTVDDVIVRLTTAKVAFDKSLADLAAAQAAAIKP